jgi:hypothetical protein
MVLLYHDVLTPGEDENEGSNRIGRTDSAMNIGARVAVAVGLAIVGAGFFGGSLRRRGASGCVHLREIQGQPISTYRVDPTAASSRRSCLEGTHRDNAHLLKNVKA